MALETLEQLFSVVVGLVPKPKKIAQELLRHVERGSNIRKVPKHTVLYEDRAVLCVAIKNLIKRSMR